MSHVSISEPKNWSVSKNDGTKLLLKRAILADKIEKGSPKKATPKSKTTSLAESPKTTKRLNSDTIQELLSMELKENADGGLPTLIIRQHLLGTPKRKTSVSKSIDETPKKVLIFDEDDDENITLSRITKHSVCQDENMPPAKQTPTKVTRSGRITKSTISYMEEDSPVKRTPRKSVRKISSDDEFQPSPSPPKTPRTPRTPRTPMTPRTTRAKATPTRTPKRSVTRRILTSQLTPTLHSRAHSVDNIDGEDVTKNCLDLENLCTSILF